MNKAIKGFEGLYEITRSGQVISFHRNKQTCLKSQKDKDGYLTVCLSKNGNQSTHKVARLVAIAYIPNPDNKPTVNHLDGDKENNNDWNLVWATQSEQEIHAHSSGLKNQKGNKNNNSKLTSMIALSIRLRKLDGEKLKDIAESLNMSVITIGAVTRNQNWV